MTRTYRAIAVARTRDRNAAQSEQRIRRFAYWARRSIDVSLSRSDRECAQACDRMEAALAALGPAEIRLLKP